ncbi:MAG: ATP-binding cassette domain-containing protein, partial [Thiohalospira sp.]
QWDPIQLRRRMGYVIQDIGLFPHFTVAKNVGLVPSLQGWDRDRIQNRVTELLELVGLEPQHFLHRYPHQLSGGQRQRVGVARALAADPPVLLMDEPFGALEALTRGTIQDELLRIWSESGQTVFMITHDVDEAILLSDRILLMTNGPRAHIAESVGVGIPRPRHREDIFHHPRYYEVRNHLMDFLVRRSKELSAAHQGSGTASSAAEDTPRATGTA